MAKKLTALCKTQLGRSSRGRLLGDLITTRLYVNGRGVPVEEITLEEAPTPARVLLNLPPAAPHGAR